MVYRITLFATLDSTTLRHMCKLLSSALSLVVVVFSLMGRKQ